MLHLIGLLMLFSVQSDGYFEHVTAASDGRIMRFDEMPIRVYIQEAPSPPLARYIQTVYDALDAWRTASEGRFRFEITSEDESADILVFWSREPGRFQRRPRIAEAILIRLEHQRCRVEIQVNLRQWPSLENWDISSVYKAMLHEIGHAVGIWGHSPNPGDVLYYANDNEQLSERDRNTLHRVYATPVGVGFHQDALSSLRDQLGQDPQDARSHYLIGTVYADMGQYAQAIAAIQKALELDPSVAAYATRLGMIFQEQGNLDSAIQQYTHAVQRRPTAALHSMLGTLYLFYDQFEKAVEHYQQAIRMDRRQSALRRNLLAIYHRWSVYLMKQERYQQAGTVLDQALQEYEFSPILNYDRAVAYEGDKKYRQAIAQYEHTLSLDPELVTVRISMASAWNNLGVQHTQSQEWEDAIHCYQQALELDPNCWEAQRNLEMNYLQQAWQQHASGNIKAAIAGYQRVLSLDPRSVDAHHNLGLVYLRQKRYTEALQCFERAVELEPESTQMLANLKYARRQQWLMQLRSVFLPVFGILFLSYLFVRWTYRRIERESS